MERLCETAEKFEELFGNTPFKNIEKIKIYIKDNYVSKNKIREKIEELNIEIKEIFCKYMTEEEYYNKNLLPDYADEFDIDAARSLINIRVTLEELLEE